MKKADSECLWQVMFIARMHSGTDCGTVRSSFLSTSRENEEEHVWCPLQPGAV